MSLSKRDYYQVLGISRNGNSDEIKKAYRRLAMKYHPDRNQGSTEAETRFKEVKEAYAVLGDNKKRAAYDQFGHAGVDPSSHVGNSSGFGEIFGDIFGDIFGGNSTGRQKNRGSDLRYNLELSLEEAVQGVEKKIRILKMVDCITCQGSGSRPGKKPKTCSACNGQGKARMQQGFFSVQQICHQCKGKGQLITDPCPSCSGQGVIRDEKRLSVKIPAGMDEGDQVRLSGEGESGGQGTSPGDLYVQVKVSQHTIFERDGDDLCCEVPISFTKMALGGEIEVPTLSGRASLKVPPGSQSEKVFRLRGKGVRNVRNGNQGVLYCKVVVETPINLTPNQKKILFDLEESLKQGGNRHSPRSGKWTNKIKFFFDNLIS